MTVKPVQRLWIRYKVEVEMKENCTWFYWLQIVEQKAVSSGNYLAVRRW